MFEYIIGNDHIKRYLTRMIETRSISNSLLFAGPDGVGKGLFAQALAAALITADDPSGKHDHKLRSGNHPDIRHYRPEGKSGMHSIESMRQFNDEVYLVPFEAKWKIFIIHDAHRMLPYSSNALLKTFEEPSEDSIIIMLSSAPESMLPTILSRCRMVLFHRIHEEAIAQHLITSGHCQADEARRIAQLSQGSIGRAVHLHKDGDTVRQMLLEFLAQGFVATYRELTDFVKELCRHADESRGESENAIKEELLQGISMKDLSAQQKQLITKEVEGAVSTRYTFEASCLFDTILSWYRDMHLLYLAGDHNLLINRDYEPEIQKKVLEAEPLSLEYVLQAIADTRISLARSTSLSICLENLFLKLNIL